MLSKSQALIEVKALVGKYESLLQSGKAELMKEEGVKKDFILPLFRALNWDIENSDEVNAEESVVGKEVDYAFRIDGIPKFFLEAKTFKQPLTEADAKQANNYSYLKSVTWAVLTNFSELKVYNAEWKSNIISQKLFLDLKHSDYEHRFDQLWLLSKDSCSTDELDKVAEQFGKKEKKVPVTPVTQQLFLDLTKWRRMLTKEITQSHHNRAIANTEELIDECVQRLIDRLIFIRVCEDTPLEPNKLRSRIREWQDRRKGGTLYSFLLEVFKEFDENYNSKLFDSKHLSNDLRIFDATLIRIIEGMYDTPEGYTYDFSHIGVEVLGTVYEQYLSYILAKHQKQAKLIESYAQRKKMGIYYTPTYVVDYIVHNTVERVLKEHKRPKSEIAVLDPACDSGSFLIGALKAIENYTKTNDFNEKIRILKENIFGVDLDPKAIEIAQLSLLLKILTKRSILPILDENLKVGNSLVADPSIDGKALNWSKAFGKEMSQGGFDVVLGNPPYVDSEEMTRSEPEMRQYLASNSLFTVAKGNWDIFCLFVEKGLQLLKTGGYLGMIVPNKLLSSEYALATRNLLAGNTIVAIRDYSSIPVFSASVYPIVIIVKKSPPSSDNKVLVEVARPNGDRPRITKVGEVRQSELSSSSWSSILEKGAASIIQKIESGAKLLGDLCEVQGAATVSEAYEIAEHIHELKNQDSYYKFINTGTIDPYVSLWGKKRTAIGKRFDKPIILKNVLTANFEKRGQQAARKKVIIGGMTKRLECYFDGRKEYLAGKSTTIVMGDEQKLKVILAILNSTLITFWYRNTFRSLSLAGGFMRVGPPQIRRVPINFGSDEQQRSVIELVDNVQDLSSEFQHVNLASDKGKEVQSTLRNSMKEIDNKVYEIYGITKQEIQVIEPSEHEQH